MKRIIFIEDRIERMKKFSSINLFHTKSIILITSSAYDDFIIKLDNGNLESIFNEFDCIISHKSALNIAQRTKIINHCEKKKKPLIFFSGGISYSFYNDDSFPYLNINANDFYSDKLKLFIKHFEQTDEINLAILQFGEKWELNKLLNFRNDLVKKINEKSIKRVRDLNLDEKLKEELNKLPKTEFISNNFSLIEENQIKTVRQVIDQLIHELL
jgi:hypothetical protein